MQAGHQLPARHLCGCSLVLRVPALRELPETGVLQVLEPWGSGSPRGTVSQPEVGGSVDSSDYVSNSN